MNSEIVRTDNYEVTGYNPDGSMRIRTEDVRSPGEDDHAIDIPAGLISRIGGTIVEEMDALCMRLREQDRRPQTILLSFTAAHTFLRHIEESRNWQPRFNNEGYELRGRDHIGKFRGVDVCVTPARESEPWNMRLVLHVAVTDGTEEGTEYVARHIGYAQLMSHRNSPFQNDNEFPRSARVPRGVSPVAIWLH